jgi:dinuclear metal center YbgI/SA1388 family protein
MAVACRELISFIEKHFPLELQENFDNSGFLVGDADKVINKALVCLDVSFKIIEEASEYGADIIISHHPLIFTPMKSITYSDEIGRCVMELIKRNVALYSSHTSFDNARGGMNDILTNMMGLKNTGVLCNDHKEKLYKIAVYVPESHEQQVRSAMLDAGAGHIGEYSYCSFNTKGTGTFLPLEGTSPYIGTQGKLEKVNEIKIETIAKESILDDVIKSMLHVHPYEEPAYDIYPLRNSLPNGTGRYGDLEGQYTLRELAERAKKVFSAPYVTIAGDENRFIKKVAVVGGAGMDFARDAALQGCDVLITGDMKHHEAIDAAAMGLSIIDAGHYYTEFSAMPELCRIIAEGLDIECKTAESSKAPFVRV